jgi:hypothetical protein
MSIVAESRHQSTVPMVTSTDCLHVVDGHDVDVHESRAGRGLRLRTMILILMLAGSIIVPGAGISLIHGGPTGLRAGGASMMAAAGPTLALRRLGNCPGMSGPCP